MAGDLGLSLNNALTGLKINQQQLATLSNNIANANTAGYSKQTLTQAAITLNGIGEGVNAGDVTRQVDQYLTQAARTQNSDVGSSGVINDYYNRIQLMLGTPGGSNSIDSYVNSFFNAVQSLGETPSSTTSQQGAVNAGVQLATQTNQLATGLQGLQYQADQDINTDIGAINTDLVNINKLNSGISTGLALGQSVAGLQDQRDAALQDLSQYIGIKTFSRTDGAINITTTGGVSILDNNLYQFQYTPVGDPSAFSNGSTISAITVAPVDQKLNPIGNPVNLTSSDIASNVTTSITGGKIGGLLQLRDQLIPNIMSQLDNLTSTITSEFNTIHNEGSGYPGTSSLTGTLASYASDTTNWSGSAQIAILGSTGQPVASPYQDEPYGMQPLTLNLGTLNTGSGAGNPSLQGIVNTINQYFGVPQNKAEVGNLNNIQMVSASNALPTPSNNFTFGFDLNNISASSSNFFVTGVNVKTNSGTDVTSVSSTIPTIALASLGTYTTSMGSTNVTIKTTGTTNLTNGETVYLSTPPAGSYNGIDASQLGGYFTISNVTSTGFDISAAASATSGGPIDVAGQTAMPPYSNVAAGSDVTTNANGLFTADLSAPAATSATSFVVSVNVGVVDASGNITTSTISYTVNNNQNNLLGTHYGTTGVTGGGKLVAPTSTTPTAVATLVDANGKELPKINGVYSTAVQGYLKIQTVNGSNVIAINSLNSQDLGLPNNTPPVAATNDGFSSYFQLNNFFAANPPNASGSTVTNSALNMQVEQRFITNPGLISLGQLSQGAAGSTAGSLPNYTYQLNAGDSSIVQQLAGLASNNITFTSAGGLGINTQTLAGYAGEIIGNASTSAASAKTNSDNSQALFTGLTTQASAVSGVNLDSELANTVIYQNAYSASARVITVVSGLFDTLLQSITP